MNNERVQLRIRYVSAPRLRAAATIAVFIACTHLNVFAQKDKFHQEWLAADVAAIQSILPRVMPVETKTLADIKAIFPTPRYDGGTDLGFGARQITFSKSGGYTYLRIDLFTLNGAIENYAIAVDSDSRSWPQIRNALVDAWRKSGGPQFEENDHALFYQKSFDPQFDRYKKAVATELGVLRGVQVPAELKSAYEYLISPLHNSVVGSGGCGFAGITPEGKKAIDALMKANRVDLVENVLRGFNPGGRVYAALALLSLKNSGRPLSHETQITIKKISSLDIKIGTCAGCLLGSRTAKEILKSADQP